MAVAANLFAGDSYDVTRQLKPTSIYGRTVGGIWLPIVVGSDGKLASTATIDASDIELGAVELKNGTSDVRATILAASTAAATADFPLVMAFHPSSPLPSGSAAIGKLAANSGVDIGDVDVTSIAAGDNNIGNVDVATLPTQAYSAAVTLTRTADANAYLANDVVGAATGSTAALTFATMGPSAQRVMITSVSLRINLAGIISGMTSYRLYLYDVTPPSAYGDNVPWDILTGDRASFLGYIDLGTPADLGGTLYTETNAINKQIKLAGTSIFAYLVTNGAYTPSSADVHVVTLNAVAL